jgi:hypothetical protein
MAKRILVKVQTPLGYEVVLTRDRWREIVRFKHPAVTSHQHAVRECLENPEVIRASAKERAVHLYFLQIGRNYLCVVAAPQIPDRYFVVTIYLTKSIKPGDELWTR